MTTPLLRALFLSLLALGLLLGCATAGREPAPDATLPAAEATSATAESGAAAPPAPSASAGKAEAEVAASAPVLDRGSGSGAGEKDLGFVEERSSAPAAVRAPSPAAAPSASGLQAGFADDNRQFNYFISFLDTYGPEVRYLPIPVQERITIRVIDPAGKSVPNARVSVSAGSAVLADGRTHADGTFLFFPSEHAASIAEYAVLVAGPRGTTSTRIDRAGKRQVEVRLQTPRPSFQDVPLDILFVLDTTGSMGEEIQRLKATIDIINLNLSSLSSRPRLRFGLVLYRDQGDEYVTDIVPLTEDMAAFRRALAPVRADGGGDDPEDLQSALRESMESIDWNRDGIRLAFVITDAAPHLDYGQDYTYVDAARAARAAGIKIFTVGTGGLDLAGELPLRQVSQYTAAKYIFLTYGEKGESAGGAPGGVSHHTGSNFQTDKLEAIIIRFAREELANLTDKPLADEGDWFQAAASGGESSAETLGKLFDMAISQIVDYASFRIPQGTPVAALPIAADGDRQAADAEYFGAQEVLSLARSRVFSMVERKDLQAILKELELQMSGVADEANAARIGKILNAEMLLTGRMFDKPEGYEVFLKLLRVETGEVLSATKLVIDRKLGLSR